MPLNLEIKARIPSLDEAREKALSLPAQPSGSLIQVDTYFVVPRGRLKLREIGGGVAELIRYERGEHSAQRMSSFDRCTVREPEELKGLLGKALGVRGVVRKERELYLLRGVIRIHLDRVERLGMFLECEVPADDEQAARAGMARIIEHFGFGEKDFCRKSYIDLLESEVANA